MASDTITLLGGHCCRPSAVRSSDSTTTMRTKLVIMMMMRRRDGQDRDQRHDLQHAVGEHAAAVQVDGQSAAGGRRRRGGRRGRRIGLRHRQGLGQRGVRQHNDQQQEKRDKAFEQGHGVPARFGGNAVFDHRWRHRAPTEPDARHCRGAGSADAGAVPTIRVSTTASRLMPAALVTPGTPKRRARRPAPPTIASTSSKAPK